ncbi:MAG: hypothetical protein AAFV19_12575 [Pseudomonadota bacterium]
MRFALSFAAALLAATPATAEWVTRQSDGFAQTRFTDGRYTLEISCRSGRGFELVLKDPSLQGFDDVKGLMLWLTLPDGRTDRWPVDVTPEGPALSGVLYVSDFNLEFFRNGRSFQLDAPLTGEVFLKGNMKGTGAARLAFLERCGV